VEGFPQSVAACTFVANFRLCKLKGIENIGGSLRVSTDSGFIRFFECGLQIEDLSFVNEGIDFDLIVVLLFLFAFLLIVELFGLVGLVGLLVIFELIGVREEII